MKGCSLIVCTYIALLKGQPVLMWLVEIRFSNLKEYAYRNNLVITNLPFGHTVA